MDSESIATEQMPAGGSLPVFPLSTVLFPGGILPLRIFEARYMDMVRACLKEQTQFGVCLILEGSETSASARYEPIGCTARILEWDMEQLGLLNIRTQGARRYEIVDSQVQKDGLIIADVVYLQDEPDALVPAEFDPCVALLKRVVADLVDKETDPMRKMVEPPYEYESASWVSNRLCEFLPIANKTKHKLMALDDPLARLTVVTEYLSRQQVI